jgi:hypothetical protein
LNNDHNTIKLIDIYHNKQPNNKQPARMPKCASCKQIVQGALSAHNASCPNRKKKCRDCDKLIPYDVDWSEHRKTCSEYVPPRQTNWRQSQDVSPQSSRKQYQRRYSEDSYDSYSDDDRNYSVRRTSTASSVADSAHNIEEDRKVEPSDNPDISVRVIESDSEPIAVISPDDIEQLKAHAIGFADWLISGMSLNGMIVVMHRIIADERFMREAQRQDHIGKLVDYSDITSHRGNVYYEFLKQNASRVFDKQDEPESGSDK